MRTISWTQGDEGPGEVVTFEYGGLDISYRKQNADGTLRRHAGFRGLEQGEECCGHGDSGHPVTGGENQSMSTLEETVAALQRRVEALETENAGLRRQAPDHSLVDQPTSRRHLLFGSAGLLGALAGGSLLAHSSVASAASAPQVEDRQVAILRISPTVMRSRGVLLG